MCEPMCFFCTRPSIEMFLSITNIILIQSLIQSKMPSHVLKCKESQTVPWKKNQRAEQNILSSSSAPQWEVRFCRFQVLCSNVSNCGPGCFWKMTGGRGENCSRNIFLEEALLLEPSWPGGPGASRTETDDLGSWGGLRGSKFSWWGEFFLDILDDSIYIYTYYIDYSWGQVPNSLQFYGSLTWWMIWDTKTLISEGGRFGVQVDLP